MNRSSGKRTDLVELRTALLAYLMGDQGLSSGAAYRVINAKYPYRQSAVADDIQRARERGWLLQRFGYEHFTKEKVDELRVLAHDYEDLARKLKSKSGHVLKGVQVFFSGADPKDSVEDDWATQLRFFGPRVSGHVMELMGSAKVIGVGWSSTVSGVVDGITARASLLSRKPRKTTYVIPTGGEPLSSVRPEASSTNLAIRLAEALNAQYNATKSPSLQSVPPVIPKQFQGKRREAVREFIACMRSYREIFKDTTQGRAHQPSWIRRLDCILCSCGTFQARNVYRNEFIDIGGIDGAELTRLAIGDIGGALIEREGLSSDDRNRFREIAELWTGIQLEDFQRVAHAAIKSTAARAPNIPGVLLCAFGKHRGEVTSDLVTRVRVVNHLVIDHSLALELARIHGAKLTLGYQR